jgi:hypothetical protein
MLRRVLLSVCLLTMSVAGLTVTNATPASAGLSPLEGRECMNFDSSNNRRLSICGRGWVADAAPTQWRGVVEMHTYILVNGHPMDRTSQSITVNQATFWPINADGTAIVPKGISFGNDHSSQTCRVNGASSSQIACSGAEHLPGRLLQHRMERRRPNVEDGCLQGVLARRRRPAPHRAIGKPEFSRPSAAAIRMVTPNTELSVDLRCKAQLPKAGEG